jgi:hypothetical protein
VLTVVDNGAKIVSIVKMKALRNGRIVRRRRKGGS